MQEMHTCTIEQVLIIVSFNGCMLGELGQITNPISCDGQLCTIMLYGMSVLCCLDNK